MKSVLILGGGFAGLEAAIYLRKAAYDVTLVSNREYLYIYPTSIWIPTNEISFSDACIDLNELKKVHGFNLIIDEVEAIDAKNNNYMLKSKQKLEGFSHVILAMGSSKMGHEGQEKTLSICGKPSEAVLMREKIEELVKKGSGKISFGFGGNPSDSSAVRGGPAFEMLFNIHNMLEKKGLRDNFELTFFAPMAEPGKRMGLKALKNINNLLERLNIKKQIGKKIKRFETGVIVFEDESKVESDLIMFIPAGDGHEVVKKSDLPQNEAGFVITDDFCRVTLDGSTAPSNIYAIGDIAALMGAEWRAKQGHVAEVMARNTAYNIVQKDNGKSEFKGYAGHINILCVMDSGNGASVVYRDNSKAFMIWLPVVGHWLKKGWGKYFRLSKLGKIPRIPGM